MDIEEKTEEKTEEKAEATIDVGVLKEWIDTDAGKEFLQPLYDRRVTQAIKTYKDGHYEDEIKARVQAEILKINIKETPEQKRIRDLEEKYDQSEKKKVYAELKTQAIQYANAKNLSIGDLLDNFVAGSEEEIRTKLDKLDEMRKLWEQQAVNRVMGANSKTPEGGDEEKLRFASLDEIEKYLERNKSDPTAWDRIRKDYEKLTVQK